MNGCFKIGCESTIYVGKYDDILTSLLGDMRVVAISDANVDRRYPKLLGQFEHILIGTGESAKTLNTAEMIYRRLVEIGADRSTFIIGIGGGIVTDLAGFVASTYMRGLGFGFVPTTLLGQIDAAIGGKNGVNVDGYKNMVGTFNQPRFVICDAELLTTLPDREFRSGLAEAVKAGIIGDAKLFSMIEGASFDVLHRDRELLGHVIRSAIELKISIVERDRCEAGERRKLNLGHTLGHAIEKCYPAVNHGEAVALGTAMIARVAVKMGVLSGETGKRIEAVYRMLGFDMDFAVDMKKLLKVAAKDKKSSGDILNIVLPTSIGSCEIYRMTVADLSSDI